MKNKHYAYYIGVALSFGVVVLSILQDVRPEMFAWLEPWVSQDSEGLQAMLKSLGFGGMVGIPGYALVQTTLLKHNEANADLNNTVQTKINDTQNTWLKANIQLEAKVSEAIKEFKDGVQASKDTMKSLETKVESFEHMLEHVEVDLTRALALILAAAEAKVNNPLVNDADKDVLNKAIAEYCKRVPAKEASEDEETKEG